MRICLVAAVLVGGFFLGGCASREPGLAQSSIEKRGATAAATPEHASLHPSFDPDAPCACVAARQQHGWCPACNVGYVAGRRIESAKLFETLDPHGHQLNLGLMACDECQSAIQRDGFCEACGRGYVKRLAYFTPLTWSLAHGEVLHDDALKACAGCRQASDTQGWCRRCDRGLVGNVAWRDREKHAMAAREYQRLMQALDMVERCDLCACAMVVHRTCPVCRVSYE